MDKEEHDKIKKTKSDWEQLVTLSEKIRDKLHRQQADFKKKLIENIGFFITDVDEFHENFMQNGPNDPKIAKDPKEAVNRLKFFTEEYAVRERKFTSYRNGETLFGLPHMEYKNLKKVGDEITRLDKLYGLYTRVNAQIEAWQEIPWTAVKDQIIGMQDTVEAFERDCTKLPAALKEKQAFNDLKKSIGDMKEILPLVTGLAKESIKERHWLEIMAIPAYAGKGRIPYDQEAFFFKDILLANLLVIKDDVEDICDQADKQQRLEKQLNEDISAFWDQRELKIGSIVGLTEPCVITGDYAETIEKLEEHLMQLQQMSAMRYVGPFKEVVTAKIQQLSETSETLEKWLKVQASWQSLVSVFGKGDIAKAMPTESKIFQNVNKKWLKIMERAAEQKNVVQCCQNDILKNDLPELLRDLDVCQKKLDAYLESKRQIFPRFYFCAAADLLKILSNGSDPNELQNDFEKLFDAINKVTFAETNKMNIKSIVQTFAGDEEELEFNEEVECVGNVEEWLGRVEKEMQRSVKAKCMTAANDCYGDFTQFVNNYQSQFALLGLQMLWTTKVTAALECKMKDRKTEFNKTKDEIVKIMSDLTALCLSDIRSKLIRTKIETLVTIHVHQRNQFMKVKDSNPPMKDSNDFNWQINTRLFKDQEKNDIKVQITDVSLYYQYEFLGVKERLCITPLTDRCYLTLSQALSMNYGGAPAGPAGTGKTETVKDLGRTLGIFVVVTNCSPEHKMIDMAKIFKGLCMSGLWGCFDEFNRISLPTLSVVAAQVESMTTAKKRKMKKFSFPGEDKLIDMNTACGYFITMNPGYAGRQALPENLKVLFRGVTMMVPNRQVIIMVKLASVGYTDYENLSFKFFWLYGLSEEQLSAQRHYDFGLRNILSVLRTAGMVKREEMSSSEEVLMARTLNDMNMSKFVFADKALFQGLIEDIFTNYKTGKGKEYKDVERELVKCMQEQNLENTPSFFIKMIQLYETSRVRHGFMVVGQAGCGKTTIYNLLTKALSNIPGSLPYEITRMNPKAITGQQMYGCNNKVGEWEEGIFSNIWKRKNAKTEKKYNWIQADGPVDAIWIENLNTVLDDNKILTLANAERIPMSDLTKMTFEVENLNNASPATVSRCGIIYVSPNELGWEPLVQTWSLDKQRNKEAGINWRWMFTADKKDNLKDKDGMPIADYNWNWFVKNIKKYFKAHDEKLGGNTSKKNTFEWCEKHLVYKMTTPEVVRITQLINLTEAVCNEDFTGNQEPLKEAQFEKIFVYALAWAIAGLCDTVDRQKFHKEILEYFKAPLPAIQASKDGTSTETIFDYYFDVKTRDWAPWAATKWEAPKKLLFSQLLIPTMDSTRSEFLMARMARLPEKKNESRKENNITSSLIVGGPGTAKTSTILMYLMKLDPNTQSSKRINFSSATLPVNFQESIDGEITKQNSKTYKPHGNKQLTVFIDDFSMPAVNLWGDQITLEITRQLMDQKGLYFLDTSERGNFQSIINLKFLAAMNHPGGGFNDVPNRIKRQFFSFNMPDPSDKSVLDIYGQILKKLVTALKSDEVENMCTPLIEATISVWRQTAAKLLKTPSKFHYSFNIRELSRVFQQISGVIQSSVQYQVIKNVSKRREKPSQQLFLVGLWRHECKRTFYDKLVNNSDKKIFENILDKATRDKFKDMPFKDPNWEEDMLMTDYLFANFQRDDTTNPETGEEEAAPFVYEACPDIESIRKRAYFKLEKYNEANPSKKMNLVFFDDALSHLLRITRIIGTPSGNALLVGVGGSGKQSLTKLASYIQWPQIPKAYFQITLTKTYGFKDLMENIKGLFERSTTNYPETCFMLTDAEIKSETFLEAINSLLATGEIPGLLGKEERELYPSLVKTIWQKEMKTKEDPPAAEMWKYFLTRVKDNLHTVLAFSPVGNKFRERAQKFPSLFSQCSIDWFLPWPLDALVDVSKKFIGDFQIECKKEVKNELIVHMGQVHNMVTEVCELYFQQFRRRVYVTPKSYLAFLTFYQTLYKSKLVKIMDDEAQINEGLLKLDGAAADIAVMKKELAVKEESLKLKSDEVNATMKIIQTENVKAAAKDKEVTAKSISCQKQAAEIAIEKEAAQKDLDAAMPIVERANKAAGGIKPADITEIRANKKPGDIFKVVFDCVLLVFQQYIKPISMTEVTIAKKTFPWYTDSYDYSIQMLTPDFCKNLLAFTAVDKDYINDETVELLEPYLVLTVEGDKILSAKNAATASKALEGLCVWCEAMSDYQKATKIVKPKMQALEKAKVEQAIAEQNLADAQAELAEVKELQAKLQAELDAKTAEKQALQDDAAQTKKKMDQASRLINSLSDNRLRWEQTRAGFQKEKLELVGNVAKASAFVCYCGPFNTEFRNKLTNEFFQSDLDKRGIPSLAKLALTSFLVTQTQVGEWAMEGLPSDDLSIQNAIMVTKSDRYPLMIDPQGQARKWIIRREPELGEFKTIFTLAHPNLKEAIKRPLEEGWPALIENIENEVDPMFDPLLEKQTTRKGRKQIIKLADTDMDFHDKFRLYMTSRMANPLFSPELAAKTTIIDFTVTQGGLEQQLLGILIGKIEKQLEDQLNELQESITLGKRQLKEGDDTLLYKLANAEGSLLDDPTLIGVLEDIKNKSKEVSEKLLSAESKTIEINERREKFRPVAARGAVLYFCIVEITSVNWMYNTSLYQFLELFDYGIEKAPKASRVEDRVERIIETLTYKVYRYINRNLFEQDKVTFKMMMCLKIMMKAGELTANDVNLLLKSGAAITGETSKYNWMELKTQNNLKALSMHRFEGEAQPFFKEIFERINRFDKDWRAFIEKQEPEACDVPEYEDKLRANTQLGHFIRLCLIRALREDRTLLASSAFIQQVLGDKKYTAPINDTIQEIYEESTPTRPVLYLLQAGADPTQMIDDFAFKRKKPNINKVSMGEAQEIPAKQKIKEGHLTGTWLILSNCQLSLELMAEMEVLLNPSDSQPHPDFRIWITCEQDNAFPLGLLQMAIKMSFVPPAGLKAGLSRTFNTQINADFLEKVEPLERWKNAVFSVCFMHSIVLERRKFGPLGFTVPYEFNYGDMESSLLYIEKHMNFCFANQVKEQWNAIRYITCEVQYGGRITDNMDREMFNTYGDIWLNEGIFQKGYNFNPSVTDFQYKIPESNEHAGFLKFVDDVPEKDPPAIFGLNASADLTFRLNQSLRLIDTLVDVQPRESSGGSGLSREDQVKKKIEEDYLKNLPPNFDKIDCEKQIMAFRAPNGLKKPEKPSDQQLPLSVFLRQEIDSLQRILDICRTMMQEMVKAIDGEVVMTPELVVAIEMIYNNRVPTPWVYDATGVEIAWLAPGLGQWMSGMHARYKRLKEWLEKDRPASFWITGFQRPQGFLTAVKQEVTRQNSVSGTKWALDEVEYWTTVQKEEIRSADGSIEGKQLKTQSQGVLIHGLFMEGAQWNKTGEGFLEESEAKDLKTLFKDFPVMHVTAVNNPRGGGDDKGSMMKKDVKSNAKRAETDYLCPVYKYKTRTDKYLIFKVYLRAEGPDQKQSWTKTPQINWKLKGCALLCNKE